jgi:hypothetical protein
MLVIAANLQRDSDTYKFCSLYQQIDFVTGLWCDCFTVGISTLAHLLPHVTLRRFCSARLRLGLGRLRLSLASAQVGSGRLTLLTRRGVVRTYLTRNRSTFNERPERCLILLSQGSRIYDHCIFHNHTNRWGDLSYLSLVFASFLSYFLFYLSYHLLIYFLIYLLTYFLIYFLIYLLFYLSYFSLISFISLPSL